MMTISPDEKTDASGNQEDLNMDKGNERKHLFIRGKHTTGRGACLLRIPTGPAPMHLGLTTVSKTTQSILTCELIARMHA